MGKILVCMGLYAVILLGCVPPVRGEVPGRIVSLAPSLTREVYDLLEQDRLVGVTSFCPAEARKDCEVVGTLTLLNVEKICALKPDLVLASTDSNRESAVEKLTSLGIRVEVFQGCESFACMCSEFVRLGALLGREREAKEMVEDIRRQVNELREKASRGPAYRVFWQMGISPLVAAGDNTFTGELIRTAGCRNIFGQLPAKYPRINLENVLTEDPEVIFLVSDMEGVREHHALWSRFGRVSAVRQGRVYPLSADLVCQPTPAMFLKALRAVMAHLFPEQP
ncbi:MAG: helical backbone metal receptor [Deltaproteobacteria bacterium]|nr:helical backbone metal receptor [Deltaproteobacteria bacterium]HPW68069.1 helical backbone metal receptor [Deltaproteobacteria bacterium]